jgi:hypothetical protein
MLFLLAAGGLFSSQTYGKNAAFYVVALYNVIFRNISRALRTYYT